MTRTHLFLFALLLVAAHFPAHSQDTVYTYDGDSYDTIPEGYVPVDTSFIVSTSVDTNSVSETKELYIGGPEVYTKQVPSNVDIVSLNLERVNGGGNTYVYIDNNEVRFFSLTGLSIPFDTLMSISGSELKVKLSQIGNASMTVDVNVTMFEITTTTDTTQVVINLELNPDSVANSVNELPKSSVSFYPNPTTQTLHLKTETHSQPMPYSILDIRGRKVAQGQISNNQIDVSNLRPGTYLLRMNGEVRRFVKQ